MPRVFVLFLGRFFQHSPTYKRIDIVQESSTLFVVSNKIGPILSFLLIFWNFSFPSRMCLRILVQHFPASVKKNSIEILKQLEKFFSLFTIFKSHIEVIFLMITIFSVFSMFMISSFVPLFYRHIYEVPYFSSQVSHQNSVI